MLRAVYVVLLRLHPRCFRQQFADEMLWIFDQTGSARAIVLLGDALRSLVTQWMFRGEFDQEPGLAGIGAPASDRVPVFYTLGSDIPPASALVNGLILSVGVFALACFALAHTAAHARIFTYYGSEFHTGPPSADMTAGPAIAGNPSKSAGDASSSGIFSRTWAKLKSALRDSSSRPPDAPDISAARTPPVASLGSSDGSGTLVRVSQREAFLYFYSVPILAALDADHDGELSPEEIANAPAVLTSLDKDHDGKLGAEECGYHPPHLSLRKDRGLPLDPAWFDRLLRRERITFMRVEPVLAALDADRDTVISAGEIRNAATSLKTLDRNHDGHLTLDEVARDPVANEVGVIFRLDTDFDGKISLAERQNPLGRHFGALLDAADRNGKRDGYVTWEGLAGEIRRRADLNHDGRVTWEEMMKARTSGALNGPPTVP